MTCRAAFQAASFVPSAREAGRMPALHGRRTSDLWRETPISLFDDWSAQRIGAISTHQSSRDFNSVATGHRSVPPQPRTLWSHNRACGPGTHIERTADMPDICEHLATADDAPARTDGCEECLQSNSTWVELRRCLQCGHVGCCDSSKNKHATKHFHRTRHPVIQSFQPGEKWKWCYVDELGAE